MLIMPRIVISYKYDNLINAQLQFLYRAMFYFGDKPLRNLWTPVHFLPIQLTILIIPLLISIGGLAASLLLLGARKFCICVQTLIIDCVTKLMLVDKP